MLNSFIKNTFGSRNTRLIKQYKKKVTQINELESHMQQLNDKQLQEYTNQLKSRAETESLNDLLVEAFAVCREASTRVLKMRHYDVQLIGAMVLHSGKIAEMRTGEGKTLVATLAVYLNALSSKGVHVVTVNDYLAMRDAKWMGQLYNFLGLSVGVVHSEQNYEDKLTAYSCDITYGTNNEFGFDYLRDNMAFSQQDQRQKKHSFAIVDEVDSILIDEARTPLIISGSTDDNTKLYPIIDKIPAKLTKQIGEINKEGVPSNDYKEGDYTVDEKNRQVHLTDKGHEKVEKLMIQQKLLDNNSSLYDPANITLMQYINAAIRAHTLFKKNIDYIIENNEIVIIDEFTGRKMSGRRWSDGLHQAVEAKERVQIQSENQTLASITFQNYFRLYEKLAGMTGTADTEAVEFQQIYKLEVVVIPTNLPTIRDDQADVVFLSQSEKFFAISEEIKTINQTGQPILIGTASIESSELLSKYLDKANIKHEILNAKQHLREAYIIAQAGALKSVTIATNMAGRGTDIVLGGNIEYQLQLVENENLTEEQINQLKAQWQKDHDQVIKLGGLYVIGTERNESRRVDNQLRGRSGRQGDPGKSRFYLSLEDDLMRIFASDRMRNMMQKLGLSQGESIEHSMINKAIENAQSKVEGKNYEIRKQLLEYDNVINDQRQLIYKQRNELIGNDDVSETISEMAETTLNSTIDDFIPPGSIDEQWDIKSLEENLKQDFNIDLPVSQQLEQDPLFNEQTIRKKVLDQWQQQHQEKEKITGPGTLRQFEKIVVLQTLDHLWKEHIAALDYLRQGIHLRGYAQKNPVQEYKREAFDMFQNFLFNLRRDIIKMLSQVQISKDYQAEKEPEPQSDYIYQHQESRSFSQENNATLAPNSLTTNNSNSQNAGAASIKPGDLKEPEKNIPFVRENKKVGRNEPCPCGSGKKFKNCHG